MITISVNNTPYQCAAQTTLQQVLEQLSVNTNGLALAVNGAVVSKSSWQTFVVTPGAQILLIQATQGG